LESILAAGEYEAAESFVLTMAQDPGPAAFSVIRSRATYRRGDPQLALRHANIAVATEPDSEQSLLNLLSLSFSSRRLADASQIASRLARDGRTAQTRRMGKL